MLGRIMKSVLLGVVVSSLFKNRYRLMNWILGNKRIRQFVVSSSMRIPGIRQFFMQSLFSSGEKTL